VRLDNICKNNNDASDNCQSECQLAILHYFNRTFDMLIAVSHCIDSQSFIDSNEKYSERETLIRIFSFRVHSNDVY
jgi:hypothetical protein